MGLFALLEPNKFAWYLIKNLCEQNSNERPFADKTERIFDNHSPWEVVLSNSYCLLLFMVEIHLVEVEWDALWVGIFRDMY